MDFKKWLPLFIILIFGLGIRLTLLNSESMWIDEVTTIYHAKSSFIGNIKWTTTDPNVPLYSIILWFWIRIFGISATAVRLLSVLFGLLSIIFIYCLGSKLFSRRVGLYAAAFLSISPFHIMYSQDARSYALFCFLSILSTYFYFSLFEKKPKKIHYIISTILLLYTHSFGFFVVIIQNIFFKIIYPKKKIISWIKLQLLLLLAFSPWISVFMYQIKYIQSYFWLAKPTIHDFLFGFFEIASNRVFFILSLIVIVYLIVNYRDKKNGYLFSLYLVPPVVTFLFSIIKTPLFLTRYFIFILPPYLLLTGLAVSKFKRTAQIILIVGFLFLQATTLFYIFTMEEKPDWRDLAIFLKANAKQDELIFVSPSYQIEPFVYYYDKDCFNENLYHCSKAYYGIDSSQDLKNYNLQNPVWYVQSEIQGKYPSDSTLQKMSITKKNITRYDFNKLRLFYLS